MQKIYRIPSRLYFDLYKKGGDKLVAVFSILKASKKGDIKYYSFTSKNGKIVSNYNLIRHYTGLTLHSIKKYTDILIEMDLCYFEENGNFVIRGNNKLKKEYTRKLVPILIGKNLIETSYSSYAVRVHSNSRQQQKSIDKKTHQRVLKSKKEEDLTCSDIKQLKRLKKKQERGFFIDKSVLSVKGFAVVKDDSINNKSKGQYWKQKLIKNNFVETTRRFSILRKMKKSSFEKEKHFLPKILKHYKGNLVKEIVSEINVKTITKNRVKK